MLLLEITWQKAARWLLLLRSTNLPEFIDAAASAGDDPIISQQDGLPAQEAADYYTQRYHRQSMRRRYWLPATPSCCRPANSRDEPWTGMLDHRFLMNTDRDPWSINVQTSTVPKADFPATSVVVLFTKTRVDTAVTVSATNPLEFRSHQSQGRDKAPF